ncbi:hypothetical protein GCM10008174_01940 [Methylopila turkensis]|uniref:Uncharacterized protein n=1 Tax=Methylopila turkensis TaxID=1437816 RepID=A0A9W6JLL0_9HYPH|nr:hypothetical protein GCM10008174_01940 [Methylopila turkensis]
MVAEAARAGRSENGRPAAPNAAPAAEVLSRVRREISEWDMERRLSVRNARTLGPRQRYARARAPERGADHSAGMQCRGRFQGAGFAAPKPA